MLWKSKPNKPIHSALAMKKSPLFNLYFHNPKLNLQISKKLFNTKINIPYIKNPQHQILLFDMYMNNMYKC